MTFCGFDKQMLDGLSNFYKGMEHAVRRDGPENIGRSIAHELSDMNAFLSVAGRISNPFVREHTTGLWIVGRAYYQGVQDRIAQGQIDVFEQQRHTAVSLLSKIDETYYGSLQGQPGAMSKLVDQINKWKQ